MYIYICIYIYILTSLQVATPMRWWSAYKLNCRSSLQRRGEGTIIIITPPLRGRELTSHPALALSAIEAQIELDPPPECNSKKLASPHSSAIVFNLKKSPTTPARAFLFKKQI